MKIILKYDNIDSTVLLNRERNRLFEVMEAQIMGTGAGAFF